MEAETVRLAGEKETLLITLYAKALESRSPDSILHDTFADDAVRKIGYDFARFKLDGGNVVGVAMRARQLDAWTREFLAANPKATVLHLGCGLDSRVFRLDPPADVRWFDVDYPEVIDLRRRLYPSRNDGYRLVGSSVTETDWIDAVPADRPAIIVAEGLMPYLKEDDVRRLLGRLTAHLPGGELVFDGYSRLGVKLLNRYPPVRATGAAAHWSLDDPRELERLVPRLSLATELLAYDPAMVARLPWTSRLVLRVMKLVPPLKRIGRLLRYRF